MGTSTDAILYYGYAPNWGIDCDAPPWHDLNPDEADLDHDEWLAGLHGVQKPAEYEPESFGAYLEKKREVVAADGIEFIQHCSSDSIMFGVAATGSVVRAFRGSPAAVDIAVLIEWRDRLNDFLLLAGLHSAALGRRGWWLVSYWG